MTPQANAGALTISNLPFDCKATLANDQKKALVKIVENEYSRKNDINDAIIKEKKEQLLDGYRKQVKWADLVKKYNAAENALNEAKKDLERVGLDKDGDIIGRSGYGGWEDRLSHQAKQGLNRIKNLMRAVERDLSVDTLKNKIIARIWMARSYGEAAVLLREVMGNEIIPSVKAGDIEGR